MGENQVGGFKGRETKSLLTVYTFALRRGKCSNPWCVIIEARVRPGDSCPVFLELHVPRLQNYPTAALGNSLTRTTMSQNMLGSPARDLGIPTFVWDTTGSAVISANLCHPYLPSTTLSMHLPWSHIQHPPSLSFSFCLSLSPLT